MSASLVLADDHPIVLEGIDSVFKLTNDLNVVAHCGTGDEVMETVHGHQPDILLLDIRMPGKMLLTSSARFIRRSFRSALSC